MVDVDRNRLELTPPPTRRRRGGYSQRVAEHPGLFFFFLKNLIF